MDTFRKEYTELTDEQKAQMLEIKEKAEELEALFEKCAPRTKGVYNPRVRLIKIAHNNLEQSVMWAVKAVTTKQE